MWIVTAAWLADRDDRDLSAGAWAGVAIYAKPFLVGLIVYWAWRRKWRRIGSALVSGAMLTLLGVALAGSASYRAWWNSLSLGPAPYAPLNGSLLGLWSRTFFGSEFAPPLVPSAAARAADRLGPQPHRARVGDLPTHRSRAGHQSGVGARADRIAARLAAWVDLLPADRRRSARGMCWWVHILGLCVGERRHPVDRPIGGSRPAAHIGDRRDRARINSLLGAFAALHGGAEGLAGCGNNAGGIERSRSSEPSSLLEGSRNPSLRDSASAESF